MFVGRLFDIGNRGQRFDITERVGMPGSHVGRYLKTQTKCLMLASDRTLTSEQVRTVADRVIGSDEGINR